MPHTRMMARSVFSVSAGSTLTYEIGGTEPGSRMVWIDRTGKERGVFGDPAPYSYSSPRISPDEKRVATVVTDPTGKQDIWIYEVADGRAMPLTFGDSEANPVWMPDGRRLVFNSNGKGVRDIHWKAVGGAHRMFSSSLEQTSSLRPFPPMDKLSSIRTRLTAMISGFCG